MEIFKLNWCHVTAKMLEAKCSETNPEELSN